MHFCFVINQKQHKIFSPQRLKMINEKMDANEVKTKKKKKKSAALN